MADNTTSSIASGSPVSLGDFIFADFASPTTIRRGAKQMLKVHKLLGGKRYIQAMGADPPNITWSGAFYGEDALDNALDLEGYCDGTKYTLQWSNSSYDVVVEEISFEEEFGYVPYTISCVILNVATNANSTVTALQSAQSDVGAAAAVTLPTSLPSVSTPLSGALATLTATSAVATNALPNLLLTQSAVIGTIQQAETTVGQIGVLADTISTTSARSSILSLTSALNTINTLSQVANPVGRAIQTIGGS